MGNTLRERQKKTKGLGEPGRLNDMIDKLQNYYAIAIQRNSGKTVEVMKKAIWDVISHVCSSKGKPYHDHCDESWCKYLQDDKNKTTTYIPLVLGYQKRVLKRCTSGPGLPRECVKEVRETLEELTNDELLKNAFIWNRVPKERCVGLKLLEIGVYDAASTFNIGNMLSYVLMKNWDRSRR